MQSVGQSWLVLELTNSPFRLGLIGTDGNTGRVFNREVPYFVSERLRATWRAATAATWHSRPRRWAGCAWW